MEKRIPKEAPHGKRLRSQSGELIQLASTKADSVQALVAKHKAKASQKEQEKELKKEIKAEEEVKGDAEDTIQEESNIMTTMSFEELGVCPEICEAIKAMGYKNPSKIQAESLPYTLKGRDMIGLAETGSGKTAAFAIPVI